MAGAVMKGVGGKTRLSPSLVQIVIVVKKDHPLGSARTPTLCLDAHMNERGRVQGW